MRGHNHVCFELLSLICILFLSRVQVFDIVRQASGDPVQASEEPDIDLRNKSREICSENILYQSDQIMRHLISMEMNSLKGIVVCLPSSIFVLFKLILLPENLSSGLLAKILKVHMCHI